MFDLIALAGLALIAWGLWQMWPPLFWVYMGLCVFVIAEVWAIGSRKGDRDDTG